MIERLLVRPARVVQTRCHFDRIVISALRTCVTISRAVLRGRGIGFACTAVARLVSTKGKTVFELGNGGTFAVSVDDRYWLQPLLLDQSYEPDVDHFLKRTMRPQDVFLDCGANLGLWCVAAAQVIHDPKRVVAVEASSATFSRLIENWEANGRSFDTLHRALSDVTGDEVTFFASIGDHASATLIPALSPADARTEAVITVSLLDLLRDQAPRTASHALIFVKIDVEGMEQQVLTPIDPMQHGEVVILYEDHGSRVTSITVFLLEQGFTVAFMADDGTLERIVPTNLKRLNELKTNSARGYNLLAIPPNGAAAARLDRLYPTLELGST